MSEQYDNTNRGAAFPPLPDQAMILTGKIDIEGDTSQIVLVKDTDRNGKNIIGVFKRMGVLYENENATPENKQPKYKGPANAGKRLSAWKQSGNNGDFLSLKIEDGQPKGDSSGYPINNQPAPQPQQQSSQDDMNVPF